MIALEQATIVLEARSQSTSIPSISNVQELSAGGGILETPREECHQYMFKDVGFQILPVFF